MLGKRGHFKFAAQLRSLYYSFLLLCKAQGGGGKNLKLQKLQTKNLIEMEGSQNRHAKKDIKNSNRRLLIDIKHIICAHKHQSATEW